MANRDTRLPTQRSGQQMRAIKVTFECGDDSHPGGPCIMHNSVSWMWSNAEDIGRLVILVVTQSDQYGCGSMVDCMTGMGASVVC